MRLKCQHEIDLSLLTANFCKLKKLAPNNKVIFMVKANAYGHGLLQIVDHSYHNCDIREFGCASLDEALLLRKNLSNLEFNIFVFSDLLLKSSKEKYLNNRILPVISTIDDLKYFLNDKDFRNLPLCVKFNTGMNRLGLDQSKVEEFISFIRASGRNEIYHLMSHFSSAAHSMHKNKRNKTQRENFQNLKNDFIEKGVKIINSSIANSGAIEQEIGLEESHIRPGLMMYGPTSLVAPVRSLSKWDGCLISSLKANIINTFKVSKGTPVGYGATPCRGNGTVVVLAIGYGDGFCTSYTGVEIKYKELLGRVLGRVNMDMVQIFFEDTELDKFEVGSIFTLWSTADKNFQNICDQSQTVAYEALLQISRRIPKVYKN